MKSKKRTLIRDLVRLFTTYSVRDWKPIVRLLKSGESKINEISIAMEQSDQPKARIRKRRVGKKKSAIRRPKAAKARKSVAKRKTNKQTRKAHVNDKTQKSATAAKRRSELIAVLEASPTSELRSLYSKATGAKFALPSRDAIIRQISDYSLKIPKSSWWELLRSLQRTKEDPTENYRRWTRLISQIDRKR